jgi:hypothetical protein
MGQRSRDQNGPAAMKTILATLPVLLALAVAARAQHDTHTVEVLSADERTWTTTWNDPGSPGMTSTNCSTTDSNVNCTSTTTGARPASSTPINHRQVDILVRMPDGNEVKMQCHVPPIWAECVKPSPGAYQARIDKHDVRLLFQTQGRPEYNKDGTIKKQGKVSEIWVKFSFE